jgi:hypothetical protein
MAVNTWGAGVLMLTSEFFSKPWLPLVTSKVSEVSHLDLDKIKMSESCWVLQKEGKTIHGWKMNFFLLNFESDQRNISLNCFTLGVTLCKM